MAQFDVFPNPVTAAQRAYPFVIGLRSDLLAAGDNAVVAPLAPRRHFPEGSGRLAPVVRIDDQDYVVLIGSLTNLPTRDLTRRTAHLGSSREALLSALDLLFYGV